MGHNISYRVLSKDTDKQAFCHEVMAESYEHGDGWNPRQLRWHDNTVFPDYDTAIRAIDNLVRRPYDDHAVLFRDLKTVPETKSIARIQDRIAAEQERLAATARAADVHNRQAKSVKCPHCGSRIMLEFYRGTGERCPVCQYGDLRSVKAVERIAKARDRMQATCEKLKEEQKKQSGNAEIKWLVKIEYHC